jgi:glutathione peroxidase
MKPVLRFAAALVFACAVSSCSQFFTAETQRTDEAAMNSIHAFEVQTLEGEARPLSAYAGKVLLVVNTASECGFTPQYEGLEKLYTTRKASGFEVLGFPCNDFGGQEPGSAQEIRTFCTQKFAVTFPMFAKVVVQPGKEQAPLYAFLGAATGKLPKWNFGKYLIGKDGKPIAFYPSTTKPDDAELAAAIDRALAAK